LRENAKGIALFREAILSSIGGGLLEQLALQISVRAFRDSQAAVGVSVPTQCPVGAVGDVGRMDRQTETRHEQYFPTLN
jgi:hypothetical protein